jgi:hypothetical protein
MKRRIIALVMALAFVVSMASVSFASEKTDGLSGLLDMFSGIMDSAGDKSENNESASDIVSGLSDLFSGITDSSGQESGNEDGSDILSGLSDLLSSLTGGVEAESEDDSVDLEATSGYAGTLPGSENGPAADSLDTIAGITSEDVDMEYDTLVDWDIKVPVPDGVMAIYSSDGYTLYPTGEESIPYVRVNSYGGYSSVDELVDDLIAVMEQDHDDLAILAGPEYITVEGREFCEIVFEYSVQGYTVQDTRAITQVGGRTYMFTAKEVSELDLYVGDLLEVVALDSIYLGEDDTTIIDGEPQDLADNELVWQMALDVIEEYGLEGDFITFDEVGLKMWLPDFLAPGTIPAEQPNQDMFIGYYSTADGSAFASAVYQPVDLTLDEYREVLDSMGDMLEDIDEFVINGLPCIVYFIPSTDMMCVSTVVEGKGLVEFTFAPVSDEDFGAFTEFMAISIQPAE